MKTKSFLIVLLFAPLFLTAQNNPPKTPADVVVLIKKQVTCPWAGKTVDTFKAGDPQTPLKGIATCMFADMEVLKKAVKEDCNFIITHEPVFYNHLDNTETFQNDQVFLEKMDFIKRNNLVIFRFHDHIHATEPDGISTGMIDKMELKNYAVNGSLTFFELPEKTLAGFALELKKKLGLETVRIIGRPEMKFSKTAFMAGAPGGQRHIEMLRNPDVEVLIAGEAPEWETYLYVNDAIAQGKNKAVIFLGHVKSEEAGMKYAAEWLQTFIKSVPVHFIEEEPNFHTL
ncbi:MAG TPA: Nif3-like dinuclear metal center hexameric protein [Draconibacterium sp.]|nr:Nif3-like dinuclear metal center hexameric protein [Draconibacterium sp.]